MLMVPVLRTLLDLESSELTEVELAGRGLELSLSGFAALEHTKRHWSAKSMYEMVMDGKVWEQDIDPGMGFSGRLVLARLNDFKPEVLLSRHLLGSVMALVEKHQARGVLWAQAIAAEWERSGHQPVTVNGLIWGHMGGSLPTKEAMEHLWVEQKVDPLSYEVLRKENRQTDNWLDLPEAWTEESLKAAAKPVTPRGAV